MSLGTLIRRAFGPFEPRVAAGYRAAFLNLEAVAAAAAAWTAATRILEVGCGEGALANHLGARYPHADYVGIDVTERVGRLFTGDRARANFHQETVGELVAREAGSFDLVVICDVLHHVLPGERAALLKAAVSALAPGGAIIIKEWEHRPTPIHLAAWVSDNILSASPAWFWTGEELRTALTTAAPLARLEREVRLRPWANNLALMARLPP